MDAGAGLEPIRGGGAGIAGGDTALFCECCWEECTRGGGGRVPLVVRFMDANDSVGAALGGGGNAGAFDEDPLRFSPSTFVEIP